MSAQSSRSPSPDEDVKPAGLRRAKAKPPQVPGYVVGEEIGRGAMGIVYRATQQIVDREVALKVLHPEHSNSPRLVSRLRREARTTARLAHPHVVSAIDMGETDGLWWYAMEYVDGVSLSERLKRDGRLSERSALRLLIPLCEALEHLYENGVVHRDIKPGNILISKVGGARLADLGLAFAEDDPSLTGRGGTLGTPHYISPEQAVDARRADVRSDLWSFGATLYHAVCGQPPFTGKSTAEILSAVLYAPIPEPRDLAPELSKGLSLILRKCLTRDLELRYQTPGELLRDLERVRERRPPKIRPGHLDPVAGQGAGRRGLWIGAATLALVSAAGWWSAGFGLLEGRRAAEAPAVLPFGPLEAVAEELPPSPEHVAERLRELQTLAELLDPVHQPRWEELHAKLILWLGERLHLAEVQSGRRIEEALALGDFAGAQRVLAQEHEPRVVEFSGLERERLIELGVESSAWMEAQQERVAGRQEGVVSEFEDQLAAWTSDLRLRIDELVDEGRWGEADALLSMDLDSLLPELRPTPLRLPQKTLDHFEELLQTGLTVSSSALHDRWRATDRDLSARLREQYQLILEDLERQRTPRPYAVLEFRSAFAAELQDLGIQLERLPNSFTVTCQGVFQQRLALLASREAELLEQDARAEIAATEKLCQSLWKTRQYEPVASLWSEVQGQMQQLSERTVVDDDVWRRNLERDCSLRRAEAALVQREVLQQAADRIVGLNGLQLDRLTVGGITLSRQKVRSGLFPLKDGFRVVDLSEPILLQELGAAQLLSLAGYDEPEPLRGERRMALASFYYHEGQFADAAALLGQEVLLRDDLEGLYWDLERRVALATGAQAMDHDARVGEALSKLDYVFNSGNQLHMSSKVKLYLDSLLGELGDLEEVRSRSKGLRELRTQLRSKSSLSPKDAIREAYRLDDEHLVFSGARDVSLEYIFDSNVVGTWQKGHWWIFDALGWVCGEKARNWEDLYYQNGPRLNLPEPLISERFELTLELEAIDGGQPQLFALSALGFNVAFFGPGLPGAKAGYGLYLKSGRFDEFLEDLPEAKRLPRESLLLPKQVHSLRLVGHRTTGALRIELDGRLIWSGNQGSSRGDEPSIQIAAWDRVRLTRVLLRAAR